MKQISVFLGNQKGELARLLELFGGTRIDLRALSLADTQDYGSLRMITDRHDEAETLLRGEGYAFSTNEITAVPLRDEAGSLAKVTRVCSDNGIGIEYAYAFLSNQPGVACVILRTDDEAHTAAVLAENGIPTATQEELFGKQ